MAYYHPRRCNGFFEPLFGEWSFISAVLAGFFFRAYQLMDQILVGDEWHSLHVIFNNSFFDIFKGFGSVDYCIPITLYYKFALLTVGLSEWVVRIPFFIFGMLGIILIPIWIRCFTGKSTANLVAWLMAISPLLIYYSRLGRPYIITFFLCLIGIFSFASWWQSRKSLHAVAYVVCTILAGFFHVVVLPYLFAPFLFFLGKTVRPSAPDKGREIKRLFLLGFSTAIPLALLLMMPLIHDADALLKKAWQDAPTGEAFVQTIRMFSGTDTIWMACILVLIALTGVCFFHKQSPALANLLAFASIVQVVGIIVIQPVGIANPDVFCRYLLPVLPYYFICIAAGIVGLIRMIGFNTSKRVKTGVLVPLAGIVVCVILVLSGPLLSAFPSQNNWFANHLVVGLSPYGNDFKASINGKSKFYSDLGRLPPSSITIVEFPVHLHIWANPLPEYQRIHGQRSVIGFGREQSPTGLEFGWGTVPENIDGVRFRNFVHLLDIAELNERNIDYVVLHKNPLAEFDLADKPRHFRLAEKYPPQLSEYVEYFSRQAGEAVFEDQDIMVFQLHGRVDIKIPSLSDAENGDQVKDSLDD